jgi:hypothetical protein
VVTLQGTNINLLGRTINYTGTRPTVPSPESALTHYLYDAGISAALIPEYVANLRRQAIDVGLLPALGDAALKEAGIVLGDRRKLIHKAMETFKFWGDTQAGK